MNEEAKAARKEYMKKYRSENREKINAAQRKWFKDNPDKAKAIAERYWAKRANEVSD